MALPGSNTGFEEGQEDGTTRAPKWTPNQARRDPKIAPQRLQNGPFRGPKRVLKGAGGVKMACFQQEAIGVKEGHPFLATPRPFWDPLGAPSWGPEGAFWGTFWGSFFKTVFGTHLEAFLGGFGAQKRVPKRPMTASTSPRKL